jgi:hypothetical protein
MTSALDEGGWIASRPGRLYPRERAGTHCTGGWVGLRAGMDRCGKSRPPQGFDPRTFQPVASRYTDWAVPAHRWGSWSSAKYFKSVYNTSSPVGYHSGLTSSDLFFFLAVASHFGIRHFDSYKAIYVFSLKSVGIGGIPWLYYKGLHRSIRTAV